jgi:hypothetical protein
MTTVYVVEFGAYSDSYVGGVYTSEDEANAVARTNDGYVSSYELDPPLSEAERRHLRPGECVYRVSMGADGNDAQANPHWGPEPSGDLSVRVDSDNVARRLSGDCWARSEEHAIKILNDRRSQWVAMGSLVGGQVEPRVSGWYVALLIPATVVG